MTPSRPEDRGVPPPAASMPPPPVGAALRWRPTAAPMVAARYDDVWFQDPRVGWAVNSNAQVLNTTDGGDSWTEQLHDPSVYLRCVAFASATRGWVGTLTPGKILFDTVDGGRNWAPVDNLPANAPSAVCGLHIV